MSSAANLLSGRFLAAITTSLLLFACDRSNQDQHADVDAPCPMDVPGTKVSVAETSDGVAITYTTTGDVAALRQRVHHIADMHEQRMHGGMGPHGMGRGMGHGHMMRMVPSTARTEDLESGARLVLTPDDPTRLADLRAHVKEHASQMAFGLCPRRQHQG